MLNQLILLTSQSGESGFGTVNLIFLGLIFAVAWLFLIRPQAKKAKAQQAFIDSVERGDKIITTGGIHGKITKVSDTTVTILVDNKTSLTVEKGAISSELSKAANDKVAKSETKADKAEDE